jgi:tetratricopeptide (TPR) repeat protein
MRILHLAVVSTVMLTVSGLPPSAMADSSAPQLTPQQIYDQAEADFDKGDWPAAIKGYALVARPPNDGQMSSSQGVIHAQLARAYAYHRETAKAAREATLALMGLGPDDAPLRGSLWFAIGEAQLYDLAISQAIEAYEKTLEAAQQAKSSTMVTRARVGLAQCYMTVEPDKAKALLDAVLASPDVTSAPKPLLAQLNDLRGRASLNLGRAQDAMPYLTKAVSLSGGIRGSKVSLLQIAIRGDAAIGALLTNHPEEAREYLAWTGAGHLPSAEWTSGLGDPPVCSEAAGIHREDMVVVEFSIDEAARASDVVAVYASRPGQLGMAFARAVKRWKWNPERIADLPPFWRRMVRIEMRCISRPNPEQLAEPFLRQAFTWLSEQQVSREDLVPLQTGYVAKDDIRLERDDLAAIPALMARLAIETDEKRAERIQQYLSTAFDKANAPAAARAVSVTLNRSLPGTFFPRIRARQLAILERTDPQSAATAWLTLEHAIALEANGRFKDAKPVLDRVLAFPTDVLGDHDPVREVAILHAAALQRRTGDIAGAEAQVNAAGLTRAQCVLSDVRPVATDSSVSTTDFPDEAARWKFDGFVREAFDIDAAGHVENARAIVAYPPFVFRSAADRTIARFRFLAPVVDGGAAGCEGKTMNIRYAKPL